MSSKNNMVTLYIDPPSHHFLNNKLFGESSGELARNSILAPYYHLKQYMNSHGIDVFTADFISSHSNDSKIVYISLGITSNYKRLSKRKDICLSAFFAMECPNVEPSIFKKLPDVKKYIKRIYTWSDSESLYPFVKQNLTYNKFYWPQPFNTVHDDIWTNTDRKFLVMINSNKLPRDYYQELYTERIRAAAYFAEFNEIDLYGGGWDMPSNRLGTTWEPATLRGLRHKIQAQWQKVLPDKVLAKARTAYRGKAASKDETLGQYTFSLCFENAIIKGWITEKIFDCIYSGTIPIYWGSPDIEEVIPPECYIDMRKFNNYDELREHLKSLSRTDINNYKEAGKAFLASDLFEPFKMESFTNLFKSIIQQDANFEFND